LRRSAAQRAIAAAVALLLLPPPLLLLLPPLPPLPPPPPPLLLLLLLPSGTPACTDPWFVASTSCRNTKLLHASCNGSFTRAALPCTNAVHRRR
jgi:hypothetical protein